MGPCIFVLPYACSSRIHFGVEALTLCANIEEYSWQAGIKDGSGAFLAFMSHQCVKQIFNICPHLNSSSHSLVTGTSQNDPDLLIVKLFTSESAGV
jgi:hypothetical protein